MHVSLYCSTYVCTYGRTGCIACACSTELFTPCSLATNRSVNYEIGSSVAFLERAWNYYYSLPTQSIELPLHAVQCNARQGNVMQCNAMQHNASHWDTELGHGRHLIENKTMIPIITIISSPKETRKAGSKPVLQPSPCNKLQPRRMRPWRMRLSMLL